MKSDWHVALAGLLAVSSLGGSPSAEWAARGPEVAPGVRRVGYITHGALPESSGLVASRQFPGVFWTHNDGGGKKQVLYAITAPGKVTAEFRVSGTAVQDWEDIAIDDAKHLFIGDLGNNEAKRDQLAVYQIDEPEPQPRLGAGTVQVTRGWLLRFPKKPFDCESLFVWRGHGYVISKVFDDKKAGMYRFPLADQTGPFVLEPVTKLDITSPVTGAGISADGRQLGVVAKSGAFVFRIDGDAARAGQVEPYQKRFRHGQIEACCFVPEGLLTTSEDRQMFLFTDEPFRPIK